MFEAPLQGIALWNGYSKFMELLFDVAVGYIAVYKYLFFLS